MPQTEVHPGRIQPLNDGPTRDARYVLYWMQQSQRAEHNDALEHAIARANALGKPLLVAFGVTDGYPDANARHYRFMLEGLADVEQSLAKRGIGFMLQRGSPERVAIDVAADACLVVCDRGYTRHQKAWRDAVADEAPCEVVQVEADVVVPVEIASNKQEVGARTLRPKVRKQWGEFLRLATPGKVKKDSLGLAPRGLDLADLDALLASLRIDRGVPPVRAFVGGTSEAKRLVRGFVAKHLTGYDDNRNQPQENAVSHMSKYLHFGQVSPVWLALQVRDAEDHPETDRASFIEELLVRREVAQNYVNFCPDYDRFAGIPRWARATLTQHATDQREHVYTREQLEDAATHDPYWNAAMREMRFTGYMHNHMRMYWGKKILEWTETPELAHATALAINNKYFIDGRDPNSYANVAWVFGLHDRPWAPRPIFGNVRYMSASGLERKCDIEGYVKKVDGLVTETQRS